MQCAIPIFADVSPETYTIDVEDLEKKVTDRTKAIIVVHLAGHPCEMDEIMRIAEEHSEFLKKKPISEAFNMLGRNYRMTEQQAAIGLVQLKKLDRMNEARRKKPKR
ncbi:MAG: hypothetical protein DRN04_04070 [Thermoprotei archaeon]|nr:MAG: hypothetical protein DRN04_04070 [Thermoprotei archaeon]